MRRFTLERIEDETGISGTGTVCEGCTFTNGKVVLSWTTNRNVNSTVIYDNIDQVIEIHGHGGRTVIKWIDEAG